MLLILLGSTTGAGCVLPIGPEFEPERNVPPYLVKADPPPGSFVREPDPVFQVTVEDQNRLDDLHVLWLIDYPPFNENITKVALPAQVAASGPDLPNQHVLTLQPSCNFHLISPTLSEHRLLLVISDRPFVDDGTGPSGERVLDQIRPGAYKLSVAWTFEKECQ
jgi:hypothetical protein